MFNLKPSYTLIAKEEEGQLGWTLEGLPSCEDESQTITREGYIIAHDLLDHVTGFESMGSINDELIAMGALWFIRGEYDEMRRGSTVHRSNESSVADTVASFGRDVLQHDSDNFNKVDLEDIEHDTHCFQGVIECARQEIISEWEHDKDLDGEDHAAIINYLIQANALLEQGYTLAQERYNDNWSQVNALFFDIVEILDKHMHEPEFEGEEMILHIDQFGGLSVEFREDRQASFEVVSK